MAEQFSLRELAEKIGALLQGDPDYSIAGVSDLEKASPTDLSFFANPRYHQKMLLSKAGAIIVSPSCERREAKNYLVHANPSEAFQRAMILFSRPLPSGFLGIHPTAVIHPSACIGQQVSIGPYVVIDQNVVVGDESIIGPFVYLGPGTRLGKKTHLHPHVVVREGCVLGDHVTVQPGAVIGSCGFGYVMDNSNRYQKLEQMGNVVLGNSVEVGANTTIDRARFESTQIGEGTKIDNLVQIAHNVEIGKHTLIVAQVGIAGSTIIGNHVTLGGKVAVNGHIQICDQVRVAACSGISKSIIQAGDYGGVPVQPLPEYNRNMVYLRKINELFHRVTQLEEAIKAHP